MTRLIGTRCKHSNVLSRGVLIARILLGNLEIIPEYFDFEIFRKASVLLNEINIYLIENKIES